jgi:hypothetical protein
MVTDREPKAPRTDQAERQEHEADGNCEVAAGGV